uniref:Uncharacterized protein n=1 Tax=Heliothis virescens TaxID=7102 RepID=A0A2A4JK28_HELVI
MIRSQNVQDRLYLSQGDETIFIDNCKIPQHHIEGIRFLFKQFKRKTRGVIINDPFSFGRNIQIILFLKAVRPLLDKPVLILCQEGDEQDWMDRFYTWSDIYDEVVLETKNPMIKNEVIINTMMNLHLFCGRKWSIVIVDGDRVTSLNPVLKLPFKADYKIWNTAICMKDNLDTFADIYKWIFPHEIFDKSYFTADPDDPVDVIEKSILLDSFLEDIVIRRDDLNSSFEKYQREKGLVITPPKSSTTIHAVTPTSTTTNTTSTTTLAPSPTVSKKNKDATGTKIKRSKKSTNPSTTSIPQTPPTTVANTEKDTSKVSEIFDSNEDFSIENYKRKSKDTPIEIIEIDNMSSQKELNLYYEPDSVPKCTQKLEEMDTLVFGHDTLISKVTSICKSTSSDKKDTEPHTILTCKPIGEPSSCKTDKCTSTSKKSYEVHSESTEREKKNDKKVISGNSKSPKLACIDSTKMNLDELNKEISDLGKSDHNAKRHKMTEVTITSVNKNEIKVKPKEVNKTSVPATVTEQVANSLKRNNIEDKMKECEEKLSKKFKGSFLDSLF